MTKVGRVKLFLVDDDALFLKNLELDFLAKGDFAVKTFRTGEELLAHMTEKPDIVILDYHLDGIEENAMNGMKVLDEIKKCGPKIAGDYLIIAQIKLTVGS